MGLSGCEDSLEKRLSFLERRKREIETWRKRLGCL